MKLTNEHLNTIELARMSIYGGKASFNFDLHDDHIRIDLRKISDDISHYDIISSKYIINIGLKNNIPSLDVILKKTDSMNFSEMQNKILLRGGLQFILNNNIAFDGPWVKDFENVFNFIIAFLDEAISNKKKNQEKELENMLNIFKNHYFSAGTTC